MQELLKTAFGDTAKGRTQTFEWFSQSKRGGTSVEDCEHSGCPSTCHTAENVEKVHKIVNKDNEVPFWR
jgi:hypothetical protein